MSCFGINNNYQKFEFHTQFKKKYPCSKIFYINLNLKNSIKFFIIKNCLNNLETNEKIHNLYLLQVQAYLNAIIYTLYIIFNIFGRN